MNNDQVIQEIYQMKRLVCFFLWSVGAMLNIQPQMDQRGQVRRGIDFSSPEGKKIADEALDGFVGLVKILVDRFPDGPARENSQPVWMN